MEKRKPALVAVARVTVRLWGSTASWFESNELPPPQVATTE